MYVCIIQLLVTYFLYRHLIETGNSGIDNEEVYLRHGCQRKSVGFTANSGQ